MFCGQIRQVLENFYSLSTNLHEAVKLAIMDTNNQMAINEGKLQATNYNCFSLYEQVQKHEGNEGSIVNEIRTINNAVIPAIKSTIENTSNQLNSLKSDSLSMRTALENVASLTRVLTNQKEEICSKLLSTDKFISGLTY